MSAAAFFNIAFSTRNSANSLRSRRFSSADETICPSGGKSPDSRNALTQLRMDHDVAPSRLAAWEYEYSLRQPEKEEATETICADRE